MKYLPLETTGAARSGYQQQVKEANIKRIFDLVRSGKCKSRAELVRMMQLSATSVSVLVEELAARGLIHEDGPTQTSLPGRRPISLRLNGDSRQLVVFSLLREGVRYALLNLDCRVLESAFYPFPSAELPAQDAGERYTALLADILEHRAQRFDRRRALVVGLNLPGVHLQSERVFINRISLGVDLSENDMLRLRDRLGLPVFLFNGTKSMAYAEKKRLDAAYPDDPETLDMVFVEICNRISCALIARGNIYTGPYDMAGEIGHFTIDYNGKPCPCGNRGCLERYVNQDVILEDAQRAAEAAGIEPPASFEELALRYEKEPPLREAVLNAARLLAFGLYSVLCSSGMRRIVLGGGIEILGEPFLLEVYQALLSRSMLVQRLELSYTQAGPDAESVGLAQYFLDKVFTITNQA